MQSIINITNCELITVTRYSDTKRGIANSFHRFVNQHHQLQTNPRPLTRGKRRRTDKVKGGASSSNLGGGELGDGLGALGDGVLRELAGEDKADRGLDLARRDRKSTRLNSSHCTVSRMPSSA